MHGHSTLPSSQCQPRILRCSQHHTVPTLGDARLRGPAGSAPPPPSPCPKVLTQPLGHAHPDGDLQTPAPYNPPTLELPKTRGWCCQRDRALPCTTRTTSPPHISPRCLGQQQGVPTSGDLADDPHGDVGAGAQAPHAVAALDPVAAVLAEHAGPRVVLAPVGVVHGGVVMPNQGAAWEMEELGLGRLKGMSHLCPSSESTGRCDGAMGRGDGAPS